MSYCVENKFEKYKVAPATEKSAATWDNSELYKTSYLCQSLKNVSNKLKSAISNGQFHRATK